MGLMTWNNKLSVNVKEVDSQHMKLVDLLNAFHDAMKQGKGKEVMGKTFSALLDYTVYHFSTEEDFMKKYLYPGFATHKRKHEALTKQASDLNDRHLRGEPVLSAETITFLKDWLSNHIMGTDKELGQFLATKGVR